MMLPRDDSEDEASCDCAGDGGQRPFANGVPDLLLNGTELVLRIVERRLALRLEFIGTGLADVGQRAGDRTNVAAQLRHLVLERSCVVGHCILQVFADLLYTAASCSSRR